MAFTSDTLSVIVQPIGGTGIRFLSYRSDDSSATITGANYFTRAASFGIQKYDLIFVSPVAGSTTPYIVNISAVNAAGDATGVIQQAQPLNANLTTLSAVTPGATGLALLDDTTPAAALTTLGVSAYAQTLLDDANAAAAQTTLGISSYAQTLLDDTSAGAAQTTLGISAYAQTLLDDANAGTAQTTLGISTYIKTLLDDADAGTAQTTLGISTYIKTLLDDADAGTAQTTLGISSFIKALLDDTTTAQAFTSLGGTSGAGWFKIFGFTVQWGSSTGTISGGAGGATITLPTSFTSSSSWAHAAFNGDNATGSITVSNFPGGKTASAFLVVCTTASTGVALTNGTSFRIDWVAIGT